MYVHSSTVLQGREGPKRIKVQKRVKKKLGYRHYATVLRTELSVLVHYTGDWVGVGIFPPFPPWISHRTVPYLIPPY